MPINLRHYQQDMHDQTLQAYDDGHKYVLNVLSTGGGKTWNLAAANAGVDPSCTIVHRQELLNQIARTYAEAGIEHNIIAPQPVINMCIEQQIKKTGRSFYNRNAPATIAGVDTIIRRFKKGDRWCNTVKKWSFDEGHHALGLTLDYAAANKWGKAAQLFPNALGFGVTATPLRADRRSLHVDQGGVYDCLVQGPDMRKLIEWGSLCDYDVIAPEPSIARAELTVGATGDFTDNSQREASKRSTIVGDVVKTYLQHVNGKQAIVFAVGTEQAEEIAAKFRAAGVTAVALDGNTNDTIRQTEVDAFAVGRTKILVNVGLFDEGFDVPAVEVTIMARATQSFGLFAQQIGRCLRPAPGKTRGIVIDHVGNVIAMSAKFGMPDTPRIWRLLQEENVKRGTKDPDAIPHRTCANCLKTYETINTACPRCATEWEPTDRASPQAVDGLLVKMSPELLHKLRMAKAEIVPDSPAIPYGASDAIIGAAHKNHARALMAQQSLNEAIAYWGGIQHAAGRTDTQMQGAFYHRFGVDVLSAQALKTNDAIKLAEMIRETYT